MPFVVAAVSTALTSLGVSTAVASAVTAFATYTLKAALMAGVSRLATDLLAPKQKQAARQASITTLSLGEQPREAIFGRAQTGGSLLWAWNYGGNHGTDNEVVVLAVADHLCDALEGFWVDDEYYAFTADGPHASFYLSGAPKLHVYWRNGAAGQTFPAGLAAGGGFTTDDLKGVAYVVFDYKFNANGKVFPSGRPSFKMLVRGKRLYDPRKDSTVGGSGAHRWTTPATWEWGENAYLCRYNWARGVYALDQVGDPEHLLIGRGLSATEAPPARAFAPANICDEDVPLKAGGTEKRYRVGGVIRADETFIEVEEMFAAAMAGQIIQPEGSVDIAPGVAQASVATITDADLVIGEPVLWSDFEPGPDRVNSIIPSYVEPAQNWQTHAAPIRRSTTDIDADGGPHEESLDLSLVTSGTQAQRCGEIRRRRVRRERRRTITLPPWFSHLEEGDWISWTSDRYDGGSTRVWEIKRHALSGGRRITVSLAEVAASDFAWTAASDEVTPGAPLPPATTAPTALELATVAATAVDIAGVPGVRVTWDTPVDEAITAIRAEVRLDGATETTPTVIHDVQAGVADITGGVGNLADVEVRLIPSGPLDRDWIASSWEPVTATPLVAEGVTDQGDLATLDQVDTPEIVDNAVTMPGQAQQTFPTTLTNSPSTGWSLASVTITTAGGNVWLVFSVAWLITSPQELYFLVYVDATYTGGASPTGYAYIVPVETSQSSNIQNNTTFSVLIPGLSAGSHDFHVYARNATGAAVDIGVRTLVCVELKK